MKVNTVIMWKEILKHNKQYLENDIDDALTVLISINPLVNSLAFLSL